MKLQIPIANPIIPKNASKYLKECLDSGWVSSKGPFVERFEKEFAKFVGTRHAVAVSSGTSALHLSLAALDIGKDDEVIVPSLTMIAAVLPVLYVNAKPVLVDVDIKTGCIDPNQLKRKISKKTKAIITVHFNGLPTDLDPILKFSKTKNIAVIEDSAEAHGTLYLKNGRFKRVGSIGDLGCFSFYGNKIITSGEGGMVTTNNKSLYQKIKNLQNSAHSKNKHFYHQSLGFSYRLSNLQAAFGLSSLEEIQSYITIKERIYRLYKEGLKELSEIKLPEAVEYEKDAYWQFPILLNNPEIVHKLEGYLEKKGIETRTYPTPLHLQPVFKDMGLFKKEVYPVSEYLSKRGLCLPTGLTLTSHEINRVCQEIKNFFR